jgi:methylated-DNA-protein-cysteine methyltransferase-like protein
MMNAKRKLNIEDFSSLVFQVVLLIPKGRATSYGAIAKAIGCPNLSRMVGRALANASEKNIPAHRVVNSQGVLSAKDAFETSTLMQELLESEGVAVENNRIKNWEKVFWNPIVELRPD